MKWNQQVTKGWFPWGYFFGAILTFIVSHTELVLLVKHITGVTLTRKELYHQLLWDETHAVLLQRIKKPLGDFVGTCMWRTCDHNRKRATLCFRRRQNAACIYFLLEEKKKKEKQLSESSTCARWNGTKHFVPAFADSVHLQRWAVMCAWTVWRISRLLRICFSGRNPHAGSWETLHKTKVVIGWDKSSRWAAEWWLTASHTSSSI